MNKNYKSAISKIEDKLYSPTEAIKLLKEISYEKFDPSFMISMNLNLNTKHADQQLRGSVILPHGTGVSKKVLVIAEGENADLAKQAGADHVGGPEMLEKIQKENWFDFDVIVTSPSFMPKFGKYGKLLGTKKLMPNPKLGTVSEDIKKAVENVKKGQIEYKTDSEANININFGKKSFTDEQLVENYTEMFNLIHGLKPAKVKGKYIKTVTLSTTMSPGIKIQFDN